MTIYRYPLSDKQVQTVQLPFDAEILAVQVLRGKLCLWARVNERNTSKETRTIEIYGTGDPMNNHSRYYMGTVQMNDLVWHVFELLL
jgi:hypothetical protein